MLQVTATRLPESEQSYDLPQGRDDSASSWKAEVLRPEFVLPIIGTLLVSLVIMSALIQFREQLTHLGNWGYLGVALAELGNSAAIIIPTPGPAYTLGMASYLNPFILGIIGGTAAGMGELVGYYLGTRGSSVIKKGPTSRRISALTQRWGGKALFLFALLPLPFDLAGLWAGTVRYPIWRFLVYVTAGKVIKITLIGFAGYYGINWLMGPLD